MKKILLLATVLLVAGSVSAQTYFNGDRADYNEYYQPRWGFEAAANLSSVSPGENFNTRTLTGFSAGFNLDLPVSYPFSIMPALLYSQKGFTATTPSGDYSQHMQTAELPILARFRSGNIFSFYFGPQVSYIMSTTNTFNGNFSSAIRQHYQYGGASVNYQGVLGAGVDVTPSFNLHARYAFDLSGVGAHGDSAYVPTYHGHMFQLGFGINI